MNLRSLFQNSISMIPADAFTNLAQLQSLFVLSEVAMNVIAADVVIIVDSD